MRYFAAFETMSEDQEIFTKLLIGSVLVLLTSCIPFLPQAILMGWASVYARRIACGEDSLPDFSFDFDYFTQLAVLGFKTMLIAVLWSLPIIIVSFLGWAVLGVIGGFMAVGGDALGLLGMILSFGGGLVMLVGILVAGVFVQGAIMRVELTDEFQSGLEFSEVLEFGKMMFGPVLIASIVTGLIGMGIMLVGGIACGVGILPATAVLFALQGNIRGQLYQEYIARGGSPWDLGEPDLMKASPPNAF